MVFGSFRNLTELQYLLERDISAFAFSQQGESHKRKDLPCQDRCKIRFLKERLFLAAIADGVGSCELSDYGAETAVCASISCLEQYFMPLLETKEFVFDDPKAMEQLLAQTMRFACDSVEERAKELKQRHDSLQSTLTVAVYDGSTLYYAHAGDDGIVTLDAEGQYGLVTRRHKGEEACSVYPLQSVGTWEYGRADRVVGFVMATDGVLDAFVRSEFEKNRVYYPFVEPVFSAVLKSPEEVRLHGQDWQDYMASEGYRRRVPDDQTFVGVVNQLEYGKATQPVFDCGQWDEETKIYAEQRRRALYPERK